MEIVIIVSFMIGYFVGSFMMFKQAQAYERVLKNQTKGGKDE